MPFGVSPQCTKCKSTSAFIWRRNENDDVVCDSCLNRSNNDEQPDSTNCHSISSSNCHVNNGSNNQITSNVVLRKSTRTRGSRQRTQTQVKSSTPKGKSRRVIFKKSATKAPTAVATPVTTDNVYYKGTYYQVGDIVAMLDVDGDVYYGQIRGLLQDQYCEKSAVITWLLPTDSSPKDRFDPSTYIVGPEEELPRKLECMEFVCHAPSEYFKAKNTPYATVSQKPELCFIWTRLRPQIKPIKNKVSNS